MRSLTAQTLPPVFTGAFRMKTGGKIMSIVREYKSILGRIISNVVTRKAISVFGRSGRLLLVPPFSIRRTGVVF